MRAMKKIWRYIKQYKKLLYISLIMLVLNQVLGLLSPLIVKEILDDHIMGIEFPWYQVEEEGDHTVYFDGEYYKQGRYFEDEETKGKQVSVFTHKSKFYFVDEPIIDGKKTIEHKTLKVEQGETNKTYSVSELDYQDVIDFYEPSFFMLKILVLLLLLRSVLSIIIGYIQRVSTANLNINMVRDARLDAIRKVQRLPINYFDNEPTGKLSNRIIHDVGGMMMLLGTLINLVINASMSFIFAYIGMFYLDAKLALISFVIYPIIYIWLRFFIKKLRKVATKVSELNSLITASLNEIINGISILQIFNYKKQTSERFDTINKEFMGEHIKEIKLHTTLGWNMINFLRGIVTAAIIVYFGYGYLNVEGMVISAGLIYAYNEYLLKVIDPLNILFRQVGNLQHAVVRTERIFKIIDGDVEDNTKERIPRYEGRIQFQNVSFAYNGKDYVVKNINLDIEPGQIVGLVGHTGSGKSSLMSLLLRFYDLKPTDKGKILIDGKDITTYSKPTYRQHIGIILQDPVLFKGTIASNIRFGADDISDEQVEEILIRIGGKQLIDKFDLGIHQEVSRAGSNLSVGEKQLISFARALIYDPAILVMDEATANIDTETETLIQKALDIVSKDRTMIIIAHRLSTIKNADKIVVLNNGEKFEEGSHKELIINNGIYASIYRSQV